METNAKLIAAKFDIVRSHVSGEEFVIEGHSKHVRGTVFLAVCLKDARGAAFFESDFTLVRRAPQNVHFDFGTSELARKTTHAVRLANT